MKLKQVPSDFKVEEVGDFKIKANSRYLLYVLEKEGFDSFYAIDYFSRRNRIPKSGFGVAGLKDRHAVTKQYVTLPVKYSPSHLGEDKLKLKLLGYVDESIRLGDHTGNRFEITVRDIRKGELAGVYLSLTLPKVVTPSW